MIRPGTVIFRHPVEDETAPDQARAFCKTRGLTPDTARIVKRGGMVEVEIKKPCKLRID